MPQSDLDSGSNNSITDSGSLSDDSMTAESSNSSDNNMAELVFGSLVWSGFLTLRAIDWDRNQSFYF